MIACIGRNEMIPCSMEGCECKGRNSNAMPWSYTCGITRHVYYAQYPGVANLLLQQKP